VKIKSSIFYRGSCRSRLHRPLRRPRRWHLTLLVATCLFLLAPSSPLWAQKDGSFSDDIDFISPDIKHKPFARAVYAANPIEVVVTVTDDRGVGKSLLSSSREVIGYIGYYRVRHDLLT